MHSRVLFGTHRLKAFFFLGCLLANTLSTSRFAAIKRHIPMRPDEHHIVMTAIERLKTGTALVYSPNCVLGRDAAGKLVKGTGRLLKVNMRKRVTSDGGQSVLAVLKS
jgi:hypothetical protein